ncbi:hypothetical protein HYX13_03595 [Candidatus Woesearchaeota archaeon]|nr:hypothetical protein [Candidatus Woesearchaeota archaeon]
MDTTKGIRNLGIFVLAVSLYGIGCNGLRYTLESKSERTPFMGTYVSCTSARNEIKNIDRFERENPAMGSALNLVTGNYGKKRDLVDFFNDQCW